MDFNTDPMSAVIALRKGNNLICIAEIVIFGSNTDEMVKEIHQRYPNRQIIIYPDPAARQRKTSAGGRTDLSILQNAGFMTKARSAHPAVRDRINSVNSRLKSGSGERHLFFTDKCKQAIKSLERQTYKEGTSQPNKDDGYDHMNDALGYMVEYLFPIKTDYKISVKNINAMGKNSNIYKNSLQSELMSSYYYNISLLIFLFFVLANLLKLGKANCFYRRDFCYDY
jgi:hypothetical protein